MCNKEKCVCYDSYQTIYISFLHILSLTRRSNEKTRNQPHNYHKMMKVSSPIRSCSWFRDFWNSNVDHKKYKPTQGDKSWTILGQDSVSIKPLRTSGASHGHVNNDAFTMKVPAKSPYFHPFFPLTPIKNNQKIPWLLWKQSKKSAT